MVNQCIKDEWRGAWHSIKWRWWEKVSNQGSTVASNIVPEGHCRQVYSILSDPGYNIGFCVVAKDKIVVLDNSISWTSMCWMHKSHPFCHYPFWPSSQTPLHVVTLPYEPVCHLSIICLTINDLWLPPRTHSLMPHSFISTNSLDIYDFWSRDGNYCSILVKNGLFYC